MKTKSMKINLLCLIFSFLASSFIIGKESAEDVHRKIEKKSHSIFSSLIEIRRDLHQHPELSGQEIRTANKIEKQLTKIGLEIKSNIGGHGVVGILRGQNKILLLPGVLISMLLKMLLPIQQSLLQGLKE